MKKIYPFFIKGIVVFILLFFDLYRWGLPLLSVVLLAWFWTKNLIISTGLLAYLGTAYGIYLVNPPKNLLQIIVVWCIEAPLKSIIPFGILLLLLRIVTIILKRIKKQKI